MDRVGVIIPVYHHSGHLTEVIAGVAQTLPREHILVVDDGSPEASALIAEALGVQVVRHDRNRGKGAALRTGFRFWREHGMEWALTLDGDGQHDPGDIPSLLEAAREGGADLIIGSRMADLTTMPPDRRFSNRTTSSLLSLLTGRKIEDSQCGFRLVRLSLLEGVRFREEGFAFESEMILRLSRRGARLRFVPVRTVYDGRRSSSMRRFRDTLRFLRMVAVSGVER